MTVKINGKPRPKIPYEHPDLVMYLRTGKANLQRLANRRSAYYEHDVSLRELFTDEHVSLRYLCEQLASYVTEAFDHYAVWDYTHAYYPGCPSQQTAKIDALEGVSRVLPTLAAWLHSRPQGDTCIQGLNNKPIDVAVVLRRAFLAGTDPSHKGYWGKLHDYDQRICESADLALALWLSRETTWTVFSDTERQQISCWFKQVSRLQTVDNNWHLFGLTVEFVLFSLTGEDIISHDKYFRIKEFHVGGGWFRDGARGNYDFYNAWGFHYSLYWLQQIIPDYDEAFMRSALKAFCASYRYFFTPEGLPLFGRSTCYRLAASAPLLAVVDIAAADGDDSVVGVGEAKRAFATNLKYFIGNGAMKNGAPTQGIFAADARLMDNYSGPASSFWSLRALNIAFYCGDRIGLWDAAEAELMIERDDFELNIPEISAKVLGSKQTGEVVVIFQSDYLELQSPLSRRLDVPSWRDSMLESILGRARRPKNNLLRKGVTCYSSKMTHFF